DYIIVDCVFIYILVLELGCAVGSKLSPFFDNKNNISKIGVPAVKEIILTSLLTLASFLLLLFILVAVTRFPTQDILYKQDDEIHIKEFALATGALRLISQIFP
ncbi:hypothetical protein ACJX0J_020898, partial [Zea mays]